MSEILIVDDEEVIRESLAMILEKKGYSAETASGGKEALKWLDSNDCDVVITDLKMDGMSGIQLLEAIKSSHPSVGVIVLTAYGTTETAVEAIKLGAFDYLDKKVDPEKILVAIKNVLEKKTLQQEVGFLRKALRKKYKLENIIGESKAIKDVCKTIEKIATTDSTVLITGETGTGKQLVAYAILNLSKRAKKDFVEITCTTLPQEILESELVGHVKGAFTGALEEKKGLFEEANQGTIFLDEIGTTSLLTQSKLLKAIEEKTIRRVGSNKLVDVDVRIIAASNRDLPTLVEKDEFRSDLYFRLNVITIFIPPLRERKEDIPLLVDHFLDIYNPKVGKKIKRADPAALRLLKKYDWPGNVRELKHMIERAVIFCNGDELKEEDFLAHTQAMEMELLAKEVVGSKFTLSRMEELFIRKVLEKCSGNRSQAARELGIGRNTLADKIKKYRIKVSNDR